jgi:hypothetical protein
MRITSKRFSLKRKFFDLRWVRCSPTLNRVVVQRLKLVHSTNTLNCSYVGALDDQKKGNSLVTCRFYVIASCFENSRFDFIDFLCFEKKNIDTGIGFVRCVGCFQLVVLWELREIFWCRQKDILWEHTRTTLCHVWFTLTFYLFEIRTIVYRTRHLQISSYDKDILILLELRPV